MRAPSWPTTGACRWSFLRTTSRLSLGVSGAEKRLDALLKGEGAPRAGGRRPALPEVRAPLPENTNVCEACLDRGQTLRRLFAYAAPYKSRLWLNLVLTLLTTIAALAPPQITRLIIDRALNQGHRELLLPYVGLLVFAVVATAVLTVARGQNVAWLGREITVSIQHSLFEKLQSLSLSFYDKRQRRLNHVAHDERHEPALRRAHRRLPGRPEHARAPRRDPHRDGRVERAGRLLGAPAHSLHPVRGQPIPAADAPRLGAGPTTSAPA